MDVGRALLKFAVGYPLGEKGLDWMKIHLVNLNGEKKKYVQVYRILIWPHVNNIITTSGNFERKLSCIIVMIPYKVTSADNKSTQLHRTQNLLTPSMIFIGLYYL